MPLAKGRSRKVISKNIGTIMTEGIRGHKVSQRQAIAVAMSVAGKSRKHK